MRCSKISTVLAVTTASLVLAGAAHAAKGVKYVHFDPAYTTCQPDQALPCPDAAGLGESNVLYVHQVEIDGQLVFASLDVPGVPDDHLWVAASYGAECKTGYHLDAATIATGWLNGDGRPGEFEVTAGTAFFPVGFDPGDKKIWDHVVDLQVPFDSIFFPGSPGNLFGIDSPEEIFDYGENVIAQRVADGMSEEEARAESFSRYTFLAMHGYAWCEGNVFGRQYYLSRSEWLPVEIVFAGVGEVAELQPAEPTPPEPGSDDLTIGAVVTQAFLYVAPDHENDCRLRLSGVFTTTEPTPITYRFVDELGLKSQLFTTEVDQTLTSMVDHYVDLPVPEPADGEIDDLVHGDGGGIGGLIGNPTDNEQGYYQIEVLEPHGYWSNVASYNVEPCHPGLNVVGGLKTPTPTPAPPPGWRPGGLVGR